MISGNLIGLMINGTFISCEISSQINLSQEMIKSSAIDSGAWQEFINGIRSWSINVNGNLLLESVGADIKTLIQTGYINRFPMFADFSTQLTSDIQLSFSGAVLFNTGSISAAAQGMANWTCTLQGTGKLNADYENIPLLIDAMPSAADYPLIIDETGGFTT